VHSTAFDNRGPSGMLWWVTFDKQSTGGEPAEQTSGKPLQEGRVVIPLKTRSRSPVAPGLSPSCPACLVKKGKRREV